MQPDGSVNIGSVDIIDSEKISEEVKNLIREHTFLEEKINKFKKITKIKKIIKKIRI